MYLEAIVLVKVGDYCSNLFMEITYMDKSILSIAYNYIYSKKKFLNVFVSK